MDLQIKGKIKYLLNKKNSEDQICQKLGINEVQLLEYLKNIKYECIQKENVQKEYILKENHNNDLCLISDVHYGIKNDGQKALLSVYDVCKEKDIESILCSGDLTDGVYKNNSFYESHYLTSWKDYVDFLVDNIPNNGLSTLYTIAGNHDITLSNKLNVNILEEIACQRDDIVYLGEEEANIKIGEDAHLKMVHSLCHSKLSLESRINYAYNEYKDKNIDILQIGHIHQSQYQHKGDMYIFQTGTLKQPVLNAQNSNQKTDQSCFLIYPTYSNEGRLTELDYEEIGFNNEQNCQRVLHKK